MAVTYEKTFEIEIINELSASVYNRVLNYVLNHELNKNDSQLLVSQTARSVVKQTGCFVGRSRAAVSGGRCVLSPPDCFVA